MSRPSGKPHFPDSRNSAPRSGQTAPGVAGIAAVSFVLVAILSLSGALDAPARLVYDMESRLVAPRSAVPADAGAPGIVVVHLDQYSLDWAWRELAVTWPWPREMYALVAEFCARAASTTFDVLFAEPSSYGPEDDLVFADAIDRAGNCVLPILPTNPLPGAPARSTASFPLLAEAAAMVGNVGIAPDIDGVFRRYEVAAPAGDIPSLALASYLQATNATWTAADDRLQVRERDGTSWSVPLDGRGRSLPSFGLASAMPFRRHNAAEIVASAISLRGGGKPQLDPSDFAGDIVLFGFSAPGLHDLQSTPVEASVPGVDIHATFLHGLLRRSSTVPVSRPLTLVFAAMTASAVAFALSVRSGAARKAIVAVAFCSIPPILSVLARGAGVWFESVPLVLAAFLAGFLSIVDGYRREDRHRAYIRAVFGQYLSPGVISRILEAPRIPALGGERRTITLVFADLAGFTALTELLDPEALVSYLNEYLSIVSEIVFDEGGTIDKYVGDAVIAFWNAPVEQPDHAVRAVRAALRIADALEGAGADVAGPFGGLPPRVRIGVSTGATSVGNMGSRLRFNYTAVGDAVNLASRLEAANKDFGTTILVSGATVEAVSATDPAVRGCDAPGSRSGGCPRFDHVARVRVPGRTEVVDVYEPRPDDADRGDSPVDETAVAGEAAFAAGKIYFAAGDFAAAARSFGAVAADRPAAAAYLRRCAELDADPPPAWDGVWTVSTK